MKTKGKQIFVQVISYFLVLLFVYTGISKLMDIGIFQAQMAQSEMLQPYTGILSWLVPFVEVALALLLLFKSTRSWGLLGSFILMLGFSFYVYLIMTYSPSLPCSCGGILQAMDWPTHLYFNLTLTLLAGMAWVWERKTVSWLWALSGCLGILVLIVVLFVTRPQPEILKDESFVRHYKELGLEEAAVLKLSYNSYYMAGINDSLVYLGNSTGFTHGLQWNFQTNDTLSFKIEIPEAPDHFAALPKWQVAENHFYMGDGVTPSLFKGNAAHWAAHDFMPFIPYYTELVVTDSASFIIKALQASTQKYVLATYQNKEPFIQLHDVLEQEPGNLFQADGKLVWDADKQQPVYLYFYRNHLTYWDTEFKESKKLSLLYAIDHSDFKTNKGRDDLYLRENPVPILHTNLKIYKEHYLVLSQVMGAEEEIKSFSRNAVIDVYRENGYQFSFQIPYKAREKVRDFYVTDQHIIVLFPTWVVVYSYKNLVMAMDKQEKPNT